MKYTPEERMDIGRRIYDGELSCRTAAEIYGFNGWIKAELFTDFHVTGDRDVALEVDEYIRFFNEQRPAYSLNYLTPLQYRERFAPVLNC